MKIEFYILLASLAFVCFYAAMRLRHELQMMQQNSYRLKRYGRWLVSDMSSSDRVTDLLMLALVCGFQFTRWGIYAAGAVGLLSMYKGVKLLLAKYKKPLVFTARAVRIYAVALVLFALVSVAVWLFGGHNLIWTLAAAMATVVLAPVVMCLSVIVLMPVERAVNRWYVNDARKILRSMPNLVIIGITGSYGKTSTKHYLHRILSERFSVVMTPGSFNTTLGVVRTVREHLKPYTEVFIVEMGAKQRGDIAEICNLVHPSIGIITAVGEQHLESFKTIENVRRTKFELIDALPADGVAILNDDFPEIASRAVDNVRQVLRYTSGTGKADYRITDVRYGRGETTFRIERPDGTKTEAFTTRLAGIHNLSNVLAGYIAGRTLGMTDDEMRYAIAGIEQVEHRLQITQRGGLTIIDDAFNSNPHGAAMALDVLASFGGGKGADTLANGLADGAKAGAGVAGGTNGGKRIVVTPGMIELGAKQQHYNREFGAQIASSCDFAVIVGEYNREAILSGLSDKGFDTAGIYTARDFADASRKVREIARPGDTILYENDLPDTFK